MNVTHPNYGQGYLIMRSALELETFTVSEIQSLTGAGENTVYSFLHKLTQAGADYLQSSNLKNTGAGRPRKRYTLTQAGIAYLTSLDFAAAFRFAEIEPGSREGSSGKRPHNDKNSDSGRISGTHPTRRNPLTPEIEEEIRRRAYEIYQERDREQYAEDWERAEAEVLRKHEKSA